MSPHLKPGWYRHHRLPHIDASGLLQHIVLRGGSGIDLVTSGAARLFVRGLLADEATGTVLMAWCVMPDHAHVACHVPDGMRMADAVRIWKARVTRAWSGAPASPFEPGYFDRFCRNRHQADRLLQYIEYNPVDAGLVRTPMDWRWSSAWWRAQGLWTPDWSRLPVFPN